EKHILYSVTKSFASAGIGIAIDQSLINDVDEPRMSFFPKYAGSSLDTREMRKISLENVLTMTTGLSWDEWFTPYGDDRNSATQLSRSNKWINFVLQSQIISDPGERFLYSSGNSILLSEILKNVSGRSAEAFIAENLLKPIGIHDWEWDNGPGGLSNTGWGLHLTPRDMIKFGQLYLQKGVWEGQQIISQAWVEQSTRPHVSAGSDSNYGYQWWLFSEENSFIRALQVNDVASARGYGGQLIFVIPHLDMVIAMTAGNYTSGGNPFGILQFHIFPAIIYADPIN
ncbi:MAG: beta-lactamase family protein, partial [Chloroflexota bacterium]